jgi:hypothetical protein
MGRLYVLSPSQCDIGEECARDRIGQGSCQCSPLLIGEAARRALHVISIEWDAVAVSQDSHLPQRSLGTTERCFSS